MLTIARNDAGFQLGKQSVPVHWHSERKQMTFRLIHAQN